MRRAGEIRTHDPLTPSQVRYQAAPQPVAQRMLADGGGRATVRRGELLDRPTSGNERLRCVLMCGRFVAASPPDELANYFGTSPAEETLEESFNVAPTSKVYSVRASQSGSNLAVAPPELAAMRWGLVPFWAKDQKVGARMINARSETVQTKPAFRSAFKKRRCLIPADGFFEWALPSKDLPAVDPAAQGLAKNGKPKKQPYFIHRADDELCVFAGLWERWYPKDEEGNRIEDADPIDSCTILTCAPNTTMESIHDRMPVFLAPGHWDAWLDVDTDPERLVPLLAPAPDSLLSMRPVRTMVNNVRNRGPELIEGIS